MYTSLVCVDCKILVESQVVCARIDQGTRKGSWVCARTNFMICNIMQVEYLRVTIVSVIWDLIARQNGE